MIREPMGGWFVWSKTGHRPTHKHETYESAAAEAQRLARETPCKKFIVLQMVAKFHEPSPLTTEEETALVERINGDPLLQASDA